MSSSGVSVQYEWNLLNVVQEAPLNAFSSAVQNWMFSAITPFCIVFPGAVFTFLSSFSLRAVTAISSFCTFSNIAVHPLCVF